jgi:hypothetical protein
MLNLYEKKYDRETLKANIYNVKLIDILKTQKIDVTFAARYILNKKYQLLDEDNLVANDVLKYQAHITYDQLQKALIEYEPDDDSVEDFETVANKK